jgi:hypothetical protein
MVYSEITDIDNTIIPTSNTYTKIGLVKDPSFITSNVEIFDNRLKLELSSDILAVGETVTQVYENNTSFMAEVHEVDGTKLGLNEKLYVLKCWCTTTNKEHWLWVEKEYAEKGPLEAIASTVRVYENMIPFIKYIKRQGDVLLFEMSEKIIPHGKIIPLTAEQYFSKLIAKS